MSGIKAKWTRMAGYDEADWHPPSEVEEKIRRARRDRSDRISNLMGQYLLKGYTMLNSLCETCGTILLQDRQGTLYCVACAEVDPEIQKDSPEISEEAAESQRQEARFSSSRENTSPAEAPSTSSTVIAQSQESQIGQETIPISITNAVPSTSVPTEQLTTSTQTSMKPYSEKTGGIKTVVSASIGGVLQCLENTRSQLLVCSSIKKQKELLSLMKICGEALASLKKVSS
ncbi:protein ZNRD2-like isoform X2 [Artemia franciscana]|uniref:protein ZNRD2-like isoform X2 n=1 Tax=Artemia franciscana TaxID=6661 RepID=UPI0032DB15D3